MSKQRIRAKDKCKIYINKKNSNTMSYNGMRAPKCQRLCQLLKHAASLV